jgi:DNA processing protein
MRRPSDLRNEKGRTGRKSGRTGSDAVPKTWPKDFVSLPEDRRALMVLLGLASLTPRRLLGLANRVGSASACLGVVREGSDASERDVKRARSTRWQDVAGELEAIGGRLVAVDDPEYPPELLDLFDPPAGVFVLGRPLRERVMRVAVVGARNASPAGREISTAIGRALAYAGGCVVSGGARGIDAAAHRGALEAEGSTVCVLGSGLDVPYPKQNHKLLAAIAERGTVVTEYAPGTPAEPFRFPARNRLVAALARAIVVVEGAAGSGSMITADHALELGREIFAVPGAVWAALAAVPLELIRQGATLIRGPADLLEDLGIAPIGQADDAGVSGGPLLSDVEQIVWQALADSSAPDRLASTTGMPFPRVVAALTTLELKGLVLHVGGRYERRAGSPSRP